MTIAFDLENIRKQHDCVNYFETGLWDPRTNVSSRQALAANFKKVFCIELRQLWVDLGKDVFKEEITTGRYNLYHDDSSNMRKYLYDNEAFNEKTLFFLDAHVDNNNIHNYKRRCPLLDELEAIGSLERKNHVIMVDDLRIVNSAFPWGETSYGNIDFLQQIKNKISSINGDYKFDTLDGHVPNDILIAYI